MLIFFLYFPGSTPWAKILYLYLYFPGSTTTRHGQRIGLPDRSSPTARRAATKIKLGSFFFLLSQKEGWNTTRRHPRRPRLNSATLRSDLVVDRSKRETERHRPQIMKALRLNLVESHSPLLWEKYLEVYLDPQEGGVCPSLSYSLGF